MCGCSLAREVDSLPPLASKTATDARNEALRADAAEWRERWGCPRGHATLPRDLAAEAEHVARITRTPVATTCPLACVTWADPWVVEITRAVALAGEWHVPVSETLGRELTKADLDALSALKAAQGDAWTSDEKIREAKRAAETRGRSGAR
jgi:phage FluMu protein gp41